MENQEETRQKIMKEEDEDRELCECGHEEKYHNPECMVALKDRDDSMEKCPCKKFIKRKEEINGKGRLCAKCGKYKLASKYWKMYGKLRSSCIECTKKTDTSPFTNCRDCERRIKKTSFKHKYCRDCIKKRDLKSAHKWLDKMKDSKEFMLKEYARKKAKYNIEIPKNQKCEICKINPAQQRHHPDYNKPLEVLFVCKSCHDKIRKGVKYRK